MASGACRVAQIHARQQRDAVVRRALVEESEIARVAELAHDVGISMRVKVCMAGEASFEADGLGSFDDLTSFERALADVRQAA